jgi:hypothetical protein
MERLLENEEGQPMTIRESSSHLQLLVNIGDGIGGMGDLRALERSYCGQSMAENMCTLLVRQIGRS